MPHTAEMSRACIEQTGAVWHLGRNHGKDQKSNALLSKALGSYLVADTLQPPFKLSGRVFGKGGKMSKLKEYIRGITRSVVGVREVAVGGVEVVETLANLIKTFVFTFTGIVRALLGRA